MWRIFETGDIQDERHILPGMVATNWGEMPSSSLHHRKRRASVYTETVVIKLCAMEDDELINPI